MAENIELHCALCGNTFVNPRLLPCLHTFCVKCIRLFMEPFQLMYEQRSLRPVARADNVDDSRTGSDVVDDANSDEFVETVKILCPVCDSEVVVPQNAYNLPINHILKNKLNQIHNKKTAHHPKCDLCIFKDVAEIYCSACDKNLCQICASAHSRQYWTNGHAVESLTKKRQTSDALLCRKHKQKERDLYCKQCRQLACKQCFTTKEHWHHEHDFASQCVDAERKHMQFLQQKIKPVQSRVQCALSAIKKMRSVVIDKASNMENRINEHMDCYIRAVEEHRDKMLDKLDSICREKLKLLKLQKISLQLHLSDLTHCGSFVEMLLEGATDKEVLDSRSVVTSRLTEIIDDPFEEQPMVNDFLEFDGSRSFSLIDGYKVYGSLTDRYVDAKRSYIKDLSTIREGETSQLTLVTVDQKSDYIVKHSSRIDLKIFSTCDNYYRHTPVNQSFDVDGFPVFSFVPTNDEGLTIHVTVDGEHIKGSPYTAHVKLKRARHAGIFHCCTFCSAAGRQDATCGCGGTMPGGYRGCGHGHPGHPGKRHWSCCGNVAHNSECSNQYRGPLLEITI